MKTFTPAQWTLIDLASQYGKDKEFFENRLTFGRELLQDIQVIDHTNPKVLRQAMQPWIDKADEPEMFCKALLATSDILAGNPTGHIIGLDAKNSGPQLLSVMCRCDVGMRNTGAIDTGSMPDLYSTIFANMDSSQDLTRDHIKKATVPYVYGSDEAPVNVFNDEAPLFVEAYNKAVPWAAWARNVLISAWNTRAYSHDFVAPDGFEVHIPVMKTKDYKGAYKGVAFTYRTKVNEPKSLKESGTKSLAANCTHAADSYIVRELQARCKHDKHKLERAAIAIELALLGEPQVASDIRLKRLERLSGIFNMVSIRGAEFIKAGHLADIEPEYLRKLGNLIHQVLANPSFAIRAIHDEFASKPNYLNQMKQHFNNILADFYGSTWLFDIIQLLTGKSYHHVQPTFDPEVQEAIRNNTYAIG